jgi:hypothetical protein
LGVEVVTEVIPQLQRLPDDFLDCLGLKIGLSEKVIDVTMSSHKREERAELVKDDIDVIGWLAIKPRDVSSNKRLSGEPKCEQLAHSKAHLINGALVVACPFGSEFLGPQEARSCEYERPLFHDIL